MPSRSGGVRTTRYPRDVIFEGFGDLSRIASLDAGGEHRPVELKAFLLACARLSTVCKAYLVERGLELITRKRANEDAFDLCADKKTG